MKDTGIDVVTGVSGYTGKYIARRLLSARRKVKTLTGHPEQEDLFKEKIPVFPFDFDKPNQLISHLQDTTILYNTYWIRFNYGDMTFKKAIKNTKILIGAAKKAGVQKIVHISITNPSEDSKLPYFRGKALVEKAIIQSGLPYAIIRPTVIFGTEGILTNNIAWLLRKFPVFTVFGSGNYQIQPVFVEDVAKIAISAGHKDENIVMDAVGPEIFTFDRLVQLIAEKIYSQAKIVHLKPQLTLLAAKLIGYAVKDVVVTGDEIKGLMSNLLVSKSLPTGQTYLTEWLDQNADRLGINYASSLDRRYRWATCETSSEKGMGYIS